jgi:threonine/homoserine/homoserine lactone efflux protein
LELLLALFIGLVSPAGAVMLPGMINMSVADCSITGGKRCALWFAGGVVTVFLVQISAAIIGANYLRSNEEIIDFLSRWAAPVLFALSLFFFYKYYRELTADKSIEEQREEQDYDRPFVAGMGIAVMNFLAIPYYFTIGSWLMSDGYLSSEFVPKVLYIVGAGVGSMALLAGYAFGARYIDRHAHKITLHLNLLVGCLFVFLAGIQAYRVFFAQGT